MSVNAARRGACATSLKIRQKSAKAPLARWPGVQQSPKQNQLTHVVGVVIRHQQRFQQQRLTVPMRNGSKQIALFARNQFLHRF